MNLDWICIYSKVMYGAQEAVKVVLKVSKVVNLLELSHVCLDGECSRGQRRPWHSPLVHGISRDSSPPSL